MARRSPTARQRRAHPASSASISAGASIAITNGLVVPVVGDPIEGGTVLVIDGTITAVGAKVKIPRDVEVVDAAGRWVLPGFVESHGHVGVHEEGNGWAGQDTNETTDPVGARFRALDAINPADEGFHDALSGGVTSVVVKPGSGNPIGGQTVAIKTWGRVVDEMVIKQPCSMKSALGENPKRVYGEKKQTPSTRLGVASVIREAMRKAQDYQARRDAADADGKPFDRDLNNEALVSVLDGEIPWCQHTHRADDIATAVRLSDEFGYRLVINHGTEAHLLADLIAERDIPVIIGPLFTSGPRWRSTSGRCATRGCWPRREYRSRSPPTTRSYRSTFSSTRRSWQSRTAWTGRPHSPRSPSTRPSSSAWTTGSARWSRARTATSCSGTVIHWTS